MRALLVAFAIILWAITPSGSAIAVESDDAGAASHAIVIDDDDGGQVDTFINWYARLKESGVPVRLRGICVSACTFILMLPPSQVCVEPTASLGFHLATVGGDPKQPLVSYTAALIRRYYPEGVRQWLVGKKLASEPVYMTADEIIGTGTFPACKP